MRRTLTLSVMVPAIIALAATVDLTWRFVPRLFDALPGQRELVFRARGDAFLRSEHSRSDADYGDLARLGNLPGLRLYRTVSFTTDGLGFRNLPSSAPVRAILLGTSFGVGRGVSDDQTLASQLTALTGCRVYNAAAVTHELPTATHVLDVARDVGLRGGVVIVERPERYLIDLMMGSAPPSIFDRSPAVAILRSTWRQRKQQVDRLLTVEPGPLRLTLQQAFKELQNDVVLPNPHASVVTKAQLDNGDWMLFYAEAMKSYRMPRTGATEYWTTLNRELAAKGFTLVVLLVPNKYTVYHGSLDARDPLQVNPGHFLENLERALVARGVAAIDLTAPLVKEAAAGLPRRRYVYLRDDTHWNAAGIAVAARVLQHHLAEEGAACFAAAPRHASASRDER